MMELLELSKFIYMIDHAEEFFELGDLNPIWKMILDMDSSENVPTNIVLYNEKLNPINATFTIERELITVKIGENIIDPDNYCDWQVEYITENEIKNKNHDKYTLMALRFPFIRDHIKLINPDDYQYYYETN